MDLTPLATSRVTRGEKKKTATAITGASNKTTAVNTPEDALRLLKDQPSLQHVEAVLRYIAPQISISTSAADEDFTIFKTSPLSSQIINVLVSDTILNYWETLLSAAGSQRQSLLRCIRSVSGIGAVVSRLKLAVTETTAATRGAQSTPVNHIKVLIEILEYVLTDKQQSARATSCVVHQQAVQLSVTAAQQSLVWKEYLSLVASGRIISITAQALDTVRNKGTINVESWLARGKDYAIWLADEIVSLMRSGGGSEEVVSRASKAAATLLGKALNLGYTEDLLRQIIQQFCFRYTDDAALLHQLIKALSPYEQKKVLDTTLSIVDKVCLATTADHDDLQQMSVEIGGSITLLNTIISSDVLLLDTLQAWLIDSSSTATTCSLSLQRVVIALIKHDEDRIQTVLESTLSQFTDPLYIAHTPILTQAALARILILSSGYVHRSQPMFLFTIARSSTHLKGTGNRLSASSPRARFLGMVVAMVISELVDKPGSRMNFDMGEEEKEEVAWYRKLTTIDDKPGSMEAIDPRHAVNNDGEHQVKSIRKAKAKPPSKSIKKKSTEPISQPSSSLRIIELTSSDSDPDSLTPYANPDSSLSDSDSGDDPSDPTSNRTKPTAPVYIRDLLSSLHATGDYHRYKLALQTAAALIRRKTSFGSEVKDSIDDLASTIAGLQDPFDFVDFHDLQQAALVAVVLALPERMGPWMARSFFEGDYSVHQRTVILGSMGLAAREMAGYVDPDSDKAEMEAFPSKMLPSRLHKIYSASTSPSDSSKNNANTLPSSHASSRLDTAASQLERGMLTPMAAQAADSLSGPKALKVRTFSSRMDVEAKRAERTKRIPNKLSKIVAEAFFFPLTGRWSASIQTSAGRSGRGSGRGVAGDRLLLPMFLKTLAILLHAAGPNTVMLPELTREAWGVFLSARSAALSPSYHSNKVVEDIGGGDTSDSATLEAVLFALLTLLEVNEDKRRVAEDFSRELLETQEWVRGVFEKVNGGMGGLAELGRVMDGRGRGDEEGERVKMLAAGVLIRCGEVVEKYQRLMVGDLLDY